MKHTLRLLTLSIVLLFSLGLAACGDAPVSSQAPESAEPHAAALEQVPTGDAVRIEMWGYFDPEGSGGQQIIRQLKMVEEQFDNVMATYTYYPDTELIKTMTMGAASGELPDLLIQDGTTVYPFIDMGIMADITDLANADGTYSQLFEGPRLLCERDGRLYGLPHNSNATALFYNVDMLEAAGVEPPETWGDLDNVCEALKASGIQYPLAICARNSEEGAYQMLPWFYSGGASLSAIGDENGIYAANYLYELVEKGNMSKEVINWSQGDTINQFMAGTNAMCVNGPWQIGNLTENAPNLSYGVVALPHREGSSSISCLGGETVGITTRGAEHMEIAYQALQNIAGKEGALEYSLLTGSFPCRQDAMEANTEISSDPVLSVFGQVVATAMPRLPDSNWGEISAVFTQAATEVVVGQKPAADAMPAAQEQIAAIG